MYKKTCGAVSRYDTQSHRNVNTKVRHTHKEMPAQPERSNNFLAIQREVTAAQQRQRIALM